MTPDDIERQADEAEDVRERRAAEKLDRAIQRIRDRRRRERMGQDHNDREITTHGG